MPNKEDVIASNFGILLILFPYIFLLPLEVEIKMKVQGVQIYFNHLSDNLKHI